MRPFRGLFFTIFNAYGLLEHLIRLFMTKWIAAIVKFDLDHGLIVFDHFDILV